MTMAPGRKKRGFFLEIVFISILLFLLLGSRSPRAGATGPHAELNPLPRGLSISPGTLR
jgi:hypothetical protein